MLVLSDPPKSTGVLCGKLGPLSSSHKPHVKNPGITYDSAFRFDRQIHYLVIGSFSSLSFKDCEKVIYAFIISCHDDHNSFKSVFPLMSEIRTKRCCKDNLMCTWKQSPQTIVSHGLYHPTNLTSFLHVLSFDAHRIADVKLNNTIGCKLILNL